jgi:hypothetical protein
MDKNLQTYVKLYENKVPVSLQESLIKKLNDADWKQHTFYNPTENNDKPRLGNAELDITYLGQDEDIASLMQITWGVIQTYVKELNFSWYTSWNGFSVPRFNRYKEGREMDLHCDHIHSLFDGQIKGTPVLSLIGALNDNYEGGDFILFEDSPVRIPAGGYLVFPSNFLYPHRVTAVTKGNRNTFVHWAW